jgi:hypothetical protein
MLAGLAMQAPYHLSHCHPHTLSYSTVLPPCSLNLRDTVSPPKKVVTSLSHWELIMPPGAGLNLNPGSYSLMSSALLPSLVPVLHWVPLCI